MIFESGVVDVLDPSMAVKKFRQGHRAALMGFHSWSQCLHSPQNQPGIERRTSKPESIHHVTDFVSMDLLIRNNATTNNVRVAIQILGRRMNNDIDTMFERSLAVRDRNVLSAIVIAPASLATFAIADMSTMFNKGLLGVSIQTHFVFGSDRLANLFWVSHTDKHEIQSHTSENRVK